MCTQYLSLLTICSNGSSVKETFHQLRKMAFLLVQNSKSIHRTLRFFQSIEC